MTTIAIIGAGLAGLTVAQGLRDRADVVVFDKSRGLGGRMATRRADPYAFDHGAQYLRARSAEFKAFLAPYIDQGIVRPWHARYVELDRDHLMSEERWDDADPRYVGVPAMNEPAKQLAGGLDVRLQELVTGITRWAGRWRLHGDDGSKLGEFDWVLSAIPAQQAAALMPASFSQIRTVREVRLAGCYALMLGFTEPLDLDWHAARIHDADVSWIAVNSSKPGRDPTRFSLVAQSSNSWAEAHIDDDPASVQRHLLKEIGEITGQDPTGAEHCVLHRWRYANLDRRDGKLALLDPEKRLAACGDWCGEGRVEAAFTSARDILSALGPVM